MRLLAAAGRVLTAAAPAAAGSILASALLVLLLEGIDVLLVAGALRERGRRQDDGHSRAQEEDESGTTHLRSPSRSLCRRRQLRSRFVIAVLRWGHRSFGGVTRFAPGDHGGRKQQRLERHRRHLPVPVEAGMDRPRRKPRSKPGGGGGVAPVEPYRGGCHAAEEQQERAEPDQAQLRGRLYVERMGIRRLVDPVALLAPLDEEAPRPQAEQRMVGPALARNPPVAVAIAVDRAESLGAGGLPRRGT